MYTNSSTLEVDEQRFQIRAHSGLPGSEDLFILGSDKHCCYTDKLQLDQRDNTQRQESIDNVDRDPQGLWQHVVTQMDLE